MKLGFAPTANTQNFMEFDEIFAEPVKRSRPSLVSEPPVCYTIPISNLDSNEVAPLSQFLLNIALTPISRSLNTYVAFRPKV